MVLFSVWLVIFLAVVCAAVWYGGNQLVQKALTSYNNKDTLPTNAPVNKSQLRINADQLNQPKVCGVCTSPDCERKHIPAYESHKLIEAEIPANVNVVLERLLNRSMKGKKCN